MNTHPNRAWLVLVCSALLFAALALALAPASAQTGCREDVCFYLPLVLKPSLVKITYAYLTIPGKQADWMVVGTVRNVTSNTTVYSVTLVADAFDKESTLLGTYTGTTGLVATFPGTTNPFHIWTDLWGSTTHVEYAKVWIDSYSETHSREYRPITVVSANILQGRTVSGEIRNDESGTLSGIEVLVQADINPPYRYATLGTATLSPGETTTYTVEFWDYFGDPVTEATVQGEGYLVPSKTSRR